MPLPRRPVLQGLGALLSTLPLAGRPGALRAETRGLRFGEPEPFTFEGLIEQARQLAAKPYSPPPRPAPELVRQIDYDEHGKLRFKPENALFRNGPGVYPVTFVFLGNFFPKSVRMYALENGQARQIVYSPDYFTVGEDSPARQLPPDTNGFAGFWIRESRLEGDWKTEEPWVTFLGASYFRAVGELGQVGMSARGVAINVADPEPEEFPDFVAHWISPAAREDDPVVVHSVHDADGLAMWTGAGERIWRPLNNPTRIFITTYSDENPKGFGLSQRDRNFDHYLDGVGYEKRPTTWIEPLSGWGKGVVELVEIPTDDEIYDNISAFWLPESPPKAGDALGFRYR